ncbi:MAG: hypothetical protein MI810_01620 [Flavobacteriales bacterium]|nr:hypothetical protein [Flavobacteriales bacterium]
MRKTIGFLILLSIQVGCTKNIEKENFRLAGAYKIEQVTVVNYANGIEVNTLSKDNVGYLELNFEGGGDIQTHDGRFKLNEGESLISLNEQMVGTTTFDWSLEDDKRISMIANDPLLTFPYALTYTIESVGKRDKKFIYAKPFYDTDGNFYEEIETIHLTFLKY